MRNKTEIIDKLTGVGMSSNHRANAKRRGKELEKRVAKAVGGERVTGARGVAVEDVSHPVFSFECKNNASIPALIRNAYEQAVRNAPPEKIPVVVFQRPGEQQPFALLPLDVFIRVSAAFPSPWRPLEWSDPQPWEDGEKEREMHERETYGKDYISDYEFEMLDKGVPESEWYVQDSSEQEGVASQATEAGEGTAAPPRLGKPGEELLEQLRYMQRLSNELGAATRHLLLALEALA